jgi:hypothetical protein
MSDQRDPATGKKPWPTPKIIDVGSVDEQTTAGVGNQGDQQGTDRWKPTAIDSQPKAILPDGE